MSHSDDFDDTSLYNQTRFKETMVDAFANFLYTYYVPNLIIFGILGNSLAIFVFYSRKLRGQSTSQYITALAISDNVFLFFLLPPWLNTMSLAPWFHEYGWCQVFVYISYVSSCLSAWLVVAFTVERLVAVCCPLQRTVLCTVARARIAIASLTAMAIVINVPVIRYATPNKQDCNINIEYLVHAARFNWIDMAFSFTLPLLLTMIMNLLIVLNLYRLGRARQALSRPLREGPASRQPAPAVSPREGHVHRQTRASRVTAPLILQRLPPAHPYSQQRITRMLLMVSTTFVILNLPAYTMRLLAYGYDISKGPNADSWNSWQQIALMCFNTNFGINFLLYCLSGQNFRRTLMQAMPWRQALGRQAAMRRHLPTTTAAAVSASITDSGAQFNTTHAGSTPDLRRVFFTHWTINSSRQRIGVGARPQPPPPPDALELTLRSIARPRSCSLTRGRELASDPSGRRGSDPTADTYF